MTPPKGEERSVRVSVSLRTVTALVKANELVNVYSVNNSPAGHCQFGARVLKAWSMREIEKTLAVGGTVPPELDLKRTYVDGQALLKELAGSLTATSERLVIEVP